MSRLTSNGLRSFQNAWNQQASDGLLQAAKHLNELGQQGTVNQGQMYVDRGSQDLRGLSAWIPNTEPPKPALTHCDGCGKCDAAKADAAQNVERLMMKRRLDQAEQRANKLADKCGDLTNELTNERARCRELERKIERFEMKAKR